MNKSQQNYCSFLRELLAIVQSIYHFKYFLEGKKFYVRTDSECLTRPDFLTKSQVRMVIFWLVEITSRFRFEISYIRGTENSLADILSRIKENNLPPLDSSELTKWFDDAFGEMLEPKDQPKDKEIQLLLKEDLKIETNLKNNIDIDIEKTYMIYGNDIEKERVDEQEKITEKEKDRTTEKDLIQENEEFREEKNEKNDKKRNRGKSS